MERPRLLIPSNDVRIGGLWKRSQCLSRFTKANYKHRVFILTEQALSYYCGTVDRVGQLKGRVDLNSVRAVEFVNESAFNLAHTLQVVYFSKKHGFVTLYITATDKSECADWVSSLRQACYFNKDMLMHYHPGALVKNKWTCCQQRGKTSLGCQPTYHLLTRSSSRYAQMRRRDTLTSSQNSRRRSKAVSLCSERRSIASGVHNGVVEIAAEVHGRPGLGLSNSCMNLVDQPPHKPEVFTPEAASSQRSSRISTEPSVSICSITLRRVSVSDAAVSEPGSEAESGGDSMQRVERQQEPKRRSRSQVAPEVNPTPPLLHFPSQLEVEQKAVPQPRPRGSSLGNNTLILQQENPPPVPPRNRCLPSSGSISFSPSVTPITEDSEIGARGMKHSKTFIVSSSISHSHHQYKLSSSMSTLPRPTIAPRLSNTDPNVIHV